MPVFSKGSKFHDLSMPSHRAWTVQRKVGEGQSAEVYSVRCEQDREPIQYAVKIEREPGIKTLQAEVKILKQLQKSPHACQLIEHGTHLGHDYIVMELLGYNVVELRKSQAPQGRWGTHTVKQLGLPMLAALEEVHAHGLLHRDVKPANFGVSPANYSMGSDENFQGTLKVIDFGLSKRYLDEQGDVIPRREGRAGFRGSTAYASIYAHEEIEQGRRDDLWSWLYVLTEMLDGGLRWRVGKDKVERQAEDASRCLNPKHMSVEKQRKKDIALKQKTAAIAEPDLLTSNVVAPDALKAISNYLKTLDFADKPDYAQLRAHLSSMPDGYPASKHIHSNGHSTHTPSHLQHPSQSPALSQVPEGQPIPETYYASAQLMQHTVPVQYTDATWSADQQHQLQQQQQQTYGFEAGSAAYGYGSNGTQAAAWSGYEQPGYNGNAAWEPAAAQYQQSWYPAHVQHNGYSSAPGVPDTPMSPLEERQGYSPNPNSALPSPTQQQGSLPAGRDAELEQLKKNAQMYLQRNLVASQHDSVQDPMRQLPYQHASAMDTPQSSGHTAEDGTANGHGRGVKRGRSSEILSQQVTAGSKRSRLGRPDSNHQRSDPAHINAALGSHDPHEIPLASDTEADTGYQGVLEMVHQIQNDQASAGACQLKRQLRNLDAAEGIGLVAWLIDGMLAQRADPSARDLVADWVTDLAEFAKQRVRLSRT